MVKGLFTRTVAIKIYHRVNGNGLFDEHNGFRTHSDSQMARHYVHNVNLTEMVMDIDTETVRETVRVKQALILFYHHMLLHFQ